MNFEDYIKNNKKELMEKEVNPDLWKKINDDLVIPKRNKKYYLIIVFVIMTMLTVFLGNHFMEIHQEQKRQLEETRIALFELKKGMNELIENESSFKRIKAVNMSRSINEMDDEIIAVLVKTMIYDENEKVRLTAVNALERFANETAVKKALIKALENSEEPFFQIKIINILSSIKEESSIPALNRIIDDKASKGYLREEAISARQFINEM